MGALDDGCYIQGEFTKRNSSGTLMGRPHEENAVCRNFDTFLIFQVASIETAREDKSLEPRE